MAKYKQYQANETYKRYEEAMIQILEKAVNVGAKTY